MKKFLSVLLLGIIFYQTVNAQEEKAASSNEKDYEDAVVLLIDAKSGMIGVSWLNEKTQKEEKLSFKVDTDKVDVSNHLNESLEFSNISVGNHVDITTIKGPDGKETVVEIVDYNAADPDA